MERSKYYGLLDSKPSLFSEGEKVLAYHGTRIYEAKVQKVEIRKNEWKYFVHYPGWNKNWDEWVGTNRLMKLTKNSFLKLRPLDEKQGVDKNPKSGHSTQTKPKISSEAKVDKEDVKNNGVKGKKRKGDSGFEKCYVYSDMDYSIQIPSTLKKQLVDDWEFVTLHDKLVKLPRSPNVVDILAKYLEYRLKVDGMMTDEIVETLKGLRRYFDKALPIIFLYNKERQQYHEAVVDNVSPSSIYGAEHLLRLFVKLPNHLTSIGITYKMRHHLKGNLVLFLKFLKENQSTFFLSAYDGSGVSEGISKGKENLVAEAFGIVS